MRKDKEEMIVAELRRNYAPARDGGEVLISKPACAESGMIVYVVTTDADSDVPKEHFVVEEGQGRSFRYLGGGMSLINHLRDRYKPLYKKYFLELIAAMLGIFLIGAILLLTYNELPIPEYLGLTLTATVGFLFGRSSNAVGRKGIAGVEDDIG